MYVVRNSFTAKPGQASSLAKQLKEAASHFELPKYRVLTDLTGDFNRVILEFETEHLTQFEDAMKDHEKRGAHTHEKMLGYTDKYLTGCREILRIS